MALSESNDIVPTNVRLEEEEEKSGIKFVNNDEIAQKKMRLYLETIFAKLNQMKKDFLKDDSKLGREDLKKQLITMACYLERTRLYLDNYIYPRDLSLNLIDVPIEENSLAERKKAMHLTERLYTIVYKDFFTAYEKAILFNSKILKITGKDIEDSNTPSDDSHVSVILNNEILEDDRDSIMMTSQDIESNKLGKDAEDAKKHISKKQGDLRGMVRILNGFYPNLSVQHSVDECMGLELTFAVKFKTVLVANHEIYMTLYEENGKPFSLTATYDHQQMLAQQYQEQNYYFVNIPLKTILTNNLALIIKFVEKKRSRGPSASQNMLNTFEAHSSHKIYKGFTILPISKLFWVSQLRVKQNYEIKEAQIYKPMNPLQIEDKYATMIERRGFKKLKDVPLTQFFNVSYQYKIEPKIKEEHLQKSNSYIVRRVNFDTHMLQSKDSDQVNLLKQKVDKYRFNDLKIDLNNALFSELTMKKSPVIRVEVALRDNYGVVYDTVYQTMSDKQFNFMQTYESLIHPIENDTKMNEGFFIRIPTKSLDTLKKIYLVFLVQTLIYVKDAKGNKIKSTNYQNDMDQLMFRTEMVAVLPLYDFIENCILKNKTYALDLLQVDDFKRPIPTKFENFKQPTSISNLKSTTDKLNITLRVISNEFTHNTYINNLLLLKETNFLEQEAETILRSLKVQKDTTEQILFHDKILDKLFQLMSHNNDEDIGDLIFQTIIVMIDLFQNRYNDYKEVLENYISKHFAHSKVYLSLLRQIRKMSEKINEGLMESAENEESNNYVLMTMKYLGIILKIVRNSFLEAQSCQDAIPDPDPTSAFMNDNDEELKNDDNMDDIFAAKKFQNKYNKSVIAEENEEDSEEEDDDEDNISRQQKRGTTRKQAIRVTQGTITGPPGIPGTQSMQHLTKRQFGIAIQKSLKNIFEGCHKDTLKTTLSLRAILYENITNIFENICDFMDDSFLNSILYHMFEEQQPMNNRQSEQVTPPKQEMKQSTNTKVSSSKQSAKPSGGILKKNGDDIKSNKTSRRSELQSVGGHFIMFDPDYMKEEQNVRALQDWNWINEDAITKLKIIAMGKILANGIFEKVQGDTNKIVMSFCNNIQKKHLGRPELTLHVFYFLHQLFIYMKSPDEFEQFEDSKNTKLKIFSKRSLDLKEFFTRILPEISNSMRNLLKDTNIEDRVKDAKLPDEVLKPFKEKASLVLLSIANSVSKDKLRQYVFNEPKKLLTLVKTLKKLTNKITFAEPYMIFFEKKKIQVVRKIIEYIIQIFMEIPVELITSEYHQTIYQCRLMIIYLWNKLAKIKQDFKKTMRSKTLVKDQLKVHKGKMLETFRIFWKKFMLLGQPWISIKGSMSQQFLNFIKLSNDKAIKLYMEVVSDTLSYEFKENQDVFNTSSSIFVVFYDLNMDADKHETAKRFYEAFEKMMCEHNELFQTNPDFQKLIRQRFQQMKGLSEAIQNVTYSKKNMKANIFYQAYCQAQLIEVLWELKLFKLLLENKNHFESLNQQLDNNLEVAYTQLRFVEVMEHQSEDDRMKLGQKEIFAFIQFDNLSRVAKYFTKAEFYEKAIEILNKQKDIAENMLYDYSLVSQIVKSQYKIYKTLSQDQDRHFAVYFKIGFFGQSFPNMLRNKEFIYRGSRLMRRADVKDRLQKFFTDAFVLEYSNFPDKATSQADKKSLQIQKVEPLTYLELKDFDMAAKTKDKEELEIGKKAKDLPSKNKVYYLENFKNKFYKQNMIDNKNGEELQRDRQIEIFKVKNKFPTIFNMQEIVKVKKFIRHAIDEACRNVQTIIDSIDQFKKTATSTQDKSDFEFLTSQIRAALESPIQGGIVKYINTFIIDVNLKGPQREKTLLLFSKIEKCDQIIYEGIQTIQSFSQDETMLTKINGDYNSFKEKMNKLRQYIEGGNKSNN